MLKVGLVGAQRGGAVLACLNRFEGVEIAAVCDLVPERARQVARQYGARQTFTAFEPLLETVDAVVIATPPPLHAPMSVAALDAGRHVLCEVPAVDDPAEAAELARAVRRSTATYMFAENCNFWTALEHVRRVAAAGLLGEVYHMEAEYLHDTTHLWFDCEGRPTWRHGYEGIKYCTHSLGPLLAIGRRRIVSACALESGRPNRRIPTADSSDSSAALFQLDNGGTVYYRRDFSSLMPRQRTGHRYFVQGTKGSAEIPFGHGDRGHVYLAECSGNEWMDLSDRSLVAYRPYQDVPLPDWAVSGGHGTAEYFMLREFLGAIREQRAPDIGIREALAMTLPGLAALESVRRGGSAVAVNYPELA